VNGNRRAPSSPAHSESASGQQDLSGRRGRVARFVQLALALDDLSAASACLKLVRQPDATLTLQVRRALVDAMVVAYGRLFPHVEDTARGLPDIYEPAGQLLVAHLHLLGMRNLMRQHRESSERRVMVGPARGKRADSLVAPSGKIIWSVRPDPLGLLDPRQVDALFQHLHARLLADAGQLLADLFAGRAAPPQDMVVGDA
jgi:hypothetical protein